MNNVVIDADRWLRSCRLPYYALAQFRKMRVGDMYLLADFNGPGIVPECEGVAAVHLERERGAFVLSAVWTLHLGRNAKRRGHLWVPATRFRIIAGRRLELFDDELPGAPIDGLRLSARVLRRSALLARWAKASVEGGHRGAPFAAMHPAFFHCRFGTESGAVWWLNLLRGPALTMGTEEMTC